MNFVISFSRKEVIENYKRPKFKGKTLINDFDKGVLKDVDIPSKLTNMQCSWVKRKFEGNFHDWRIIPLFPIEKYFGKNFKFHRSLDITQYLIRKMPEYHKETLLNWRKFLSYNSSVPSTILSQYRWFHKHIKTGNNSVYFCHFSNHSISFIGNLVDINGSYRSWDTINMNTT